jgi:hypothetical protein
MKMSRSSMAVIVIALTMTVVTGYTIGSVDCLTENQCTYAGAGWAQWLWDNAFSKPWWPMPEMPK